jgi:hypothetical protein
MQPVEISDGHGAAACASELSRALFHGIENPKRHQT